MKPRLCERQPFRHHRDRLSVVVNQHRGAAQPMRGFADRAAPCEEIQHAIAGVRVDAHDAIDDRQRLLRRVARLFTAARTDDRVPPGIGRRLAARRLLRPDEAGSHAGNAVDVVIPIGVVRRVFGVPENVVVLRRPSPRRACAVVIRPHNFVDKRLAPEDRIEQHLAVVHLAVVDVKEE